MPSEFLHNHPHKEKTLGLDENHVIVDREDWEKARSIVLDENEMRNIGGGCGFYGIDEARTILIAHENVVSYPEFPKNGEWVHADDPDIYLAGIKQTLTKEQFRAEFMCIRPDVVEKFKNQMSQLKSAAIEVSSAIESLGENKSIQSFNENKKRKGHERPYKYHR